MPTRGCLKRPSITTQDKTYAQNERHQAIDGSFIRYGPNAEIKKFATEGRVGVK